MLNPWTPIEVATTLLLWAAYLLTTTTVHTRIRRHHPNWEARAELAAGTTGLALFATLVYLVG